MLHHLLPAGDGVLFGRPATTAYYAAAPTTTYYAAAPTTTYYAAAPTTTYYAAPYHDVLRRRPRDGVLRSARVLLRTGVLSGEKRILYRGWRW